MVYRVGVTSGTKATLMTQQIGDFNLQVALKEQKKLEEVLDKAMDAYNQKLKEIVDKDILIVNLQKQLGKRLEVERRPVAQIFVSSTHPPSTKPIVEIPGTPRSPTYYTHDDLKEEMSKLKVAQIGAKINFENKLRYKINYLLNRMDWPTFCKEVNKLADILKGLRDNEPTVRAILDRWVKGE